MATRPVTRPATRAATRPLSAGPREVTAGPESINNELFWGIGVTFAILGVLIFAGQYTPWTKAITGWGWGLRLTSFCFAVIGLGVALGADASTYLTQPYWLAGFLALVYMLITPASIFFTTMTAGAWNPRERVRKIFPDVEERVRYLQRITDVAQQRRIEREQERDEREREREDYEIL